MSWSPRHPSGYRDIEELSLERGLEVDHGTVNRWVLAHAPSVERRLRPFRKPHERLDDFLERSGMDIDMPTVAWQCQIRVAA